MNDFTMWVLAFVGFVCCICLLWIHEWDIEALFFEEIEDEKGGQKNV